MQIGGPLLVRLLFAFHYAAAIAFVGSAEAEGSLARFGDVRLAICIAARFGRALGEGLWGFRCRESFVVLLAACSHAGRHGHRRRRNQ